MKATTGPDTKGMYILKAILFCAIFTGLFIALSFAKSLIPGQFERAAHGIIGTVAALLTTFLFLKFDKRSFADTGLKFERNTIKKFFTGVLTGIGIMGILVMCTIYFSGFKIEANQNSSILNFLFCTLPLIPLAFLEEVGFRAYPLVLLKDKVGYRSSIIITSILFALYHIANGWTIQDAFLGPGAWGILFGSVAIYSNGISMATGLHYAVNLTTSVFGISNNSFNILVLKQKDGSGLENYQAGQLATLIPQVCLLIFAVICMEWLRRKKDYGGRF